MAFCPVCSAELKTGALGDCWNCGADFTSPLAWKPVDRPPGTFTRRTTEAALPSQSRWPAFFKRLALGFAVWCVLGLLAVLSAIPYGGGGAFVAVWVLGTIFIPVWALAAFVQ
jgi:hypothetical protein